MFRRLMIVWAALALSPPIASAAEPSPPLLASSPASIRPLMIGQQLPDVTLKDADGKPVKLSAALEGAPAVLVVYRGGWCPYGSKQFAELEHVEKRLESLGYRVIVISPDSPEEVKTARKVHDFGYTLLSDASLEAIRAMGVGYNVTADNFGNREAFTKWRARHASTADDQLGLPVPAVFLLTSNRRVIHQYVNIDIQVPVSGEVLLTAARVYGGR